MISVSLTRVAQVRVRGGTHPGTQFYVHWRALGNLREWPRASRRRHLAPRDSGSPIHATNV